MCTDFSQKKEPDSINACIDLEKEPKHYMARLRNLAMACAVYESWGCRPMLWGLDLEAAYRQCPKAVPELWQQARIWKGGWTLDLRAVFGDRSLVHKFTRLSNKIVHWLRGRQAQRAEAWKEFAAFRTARARELGSAQASLAWIMMYIDDLLGVSISAEVAEVDLADAEYLIETEVGMPTSRDKRISPCRAADGLGGHIDLDAKTVTLSESFEAKMRRRTKAVVDVAEGETFSHKELESLVYSQAHVALFFPKLKLKLYESFAFFRANPNRSCFDGASLPAGVRSFCLEVLHEMQSGKALPLMPCLEFPRQGDRHRGDVESDASGNIGFGAILFHGAKEVPLYAFWGKWEPEELEIHINVKEHMTTLWSALLFGDLCVGDYIHEWIDNKTSVAVAGSGKSHSEALRRIQEGRHSAHEACGWVTRQSYIPTDMNKVADALSRGREDLAKDALEARGRRWDEVVRLEIPGQFRSLPTELGLVSLAAQV